MCTFFSDFFFFFFFASYYYYYYIYIFFDSISALRFPSTAVPCYSRLNLTNQIVRSQNLALETWCRCVPSSLIGTPAPRQGCDYFTRCFPLDNNFLLTFHPKNLLSLDAILMMSYKNHFHSKSYLKVASKRFH